MDRTCGTLLGGRVRYAQPRIGYRTGIEPVLLAAAVPACPGQRVLEAGTGAGAGLLCLVARVPGLTAVGIEIDPAMSALARDNAETNRAPITVVTLDVADAPDLGTFDHALANPPWHDPAGTPPSNSARHLALHRAVDGLPGWIIPLAATLAPGGTLTLILPSRVIDEARRSMADVGLGQSLHIPLWPRAGVRAKLAILQGRRACGRRRTAEGLILHGPDGYTAAAEAILRGGAALEA